MDPRPCQFDISPYHFVIFVQIVTKYLHSFPNNIQIYYIIPTNCDLISSAKSLNVFRMIWSEAFVLELSWLTSLRYLNSR